MKKGFRFQVSGVSKRLASRRPAALMWTLVATAGVGRVSVAALVGAEIDLTLTHV